MVNTAFNQEFAKRRAEALAAAIAHLQKNLDPSKEKAPYLFGEKEPTMR
jgi:hypothetical protein